MGDKGQCPKYQPNKQNSSVFDLPLGGNYLRRRKRCRE